MKKTRGSKEESEKDNEKGRGRFREKDREKYPLEKDIFGF